MKQFVALVLLITFTVNCKKKDVPQIPGGTNTCTVTGIPDDLRNGIVSYFPFCGNADDVSGNNNDGSLTLANLTNDRFGNAESAVQFNSESALMCTSNSYLGPQTFTISLWIKTRVLNYRRIVVFNNSQCDHINDWDRTIFLQSGKAGFYVYPGSEQSISGGPVVADNKWHHIAATLDGSGMKLYVDGLPAASNPLVTSAQNFTGYWRLGGFQNTTPVGSYDNFLIYDRALRSVEIQQLYRYGKKRSSN